MLIYLYHRKSFSLLAGIQNVIMRRYEMNKMLTVWALVGIWLACVNVASAAPDIEMVRVPGGCFKMGFGVDHLKLHDVCVEDFSIGKYEVTHEQWQAVMGSNPSYFKMCDSSCPVEDVSFNDVQQFISKLNKDTGKKYRLPYEAEWEYAARSGGRDEVWAGTSNQANLEEYAWIQDNSIRTTYPVGKKRPNGLGIYDMSGNVWEWCQDWYDENYYGKSPQKNPRGPQSGSVRVMRGGSWDGSAGHARAAFRGGIVPSLRLSFIGFRLVLPSVQ
jgi:formylglycine-generating enzyme required for sulfatase activity